MQAASVRRDGGQDNRVGAELGLGSKLKLVCNAWIGALAAAVGQSFALAKGLDLDQQLMLDALDGAAAGSPYLQTKGKAIIESSYAPQFSVDGVRKDTGLIRDALVASGLSTALVDGVRAAFDAASEAGHGDDEWPRSTSDSDYPPPVTMPDRSLRRRGRSTVAFSARD